MSIAVMTHVWNNSKQEGGALLLLLALADFSDDNGNSFPSVDTLARKTRLSERHVQRLLRKLKKENEIGILTNEGPFGCNLYNIRGVTKCHPRVTSEAEGGDICSTGGVTRESPEPLIKPSIEPLKNPPLPFNGPFALSWQDFQTHRKQIKHPLTPLASERLLKKLAAYSEETAIAMLEQSIEHGWQGVFDVKGKPPKPAQLILEGDAADREMMRRFVQDNPRHPLAEEYRKKLQGE
jgi:hypothetical protein